MTRLICFAVPDDGEYVCVPKVATEDQLYAWSDCDATASMSDCYSAMLAAAPEGRVVELPDDLTTGLLLDEIERRAKTSLDNSPRR